MQFVVIAPWKLAPGPAKNWADEFSARINKSAQLNFCLSQKNLDSDKSIEQFLVKECEKIIQGHGLLYFLDERGQNPCSEKFANEISSARDRGVRQIGFVFGGAYGLPAGLSPFLNSGRLLSLSNATFAHELSLVVLLEQLYRAETIRAHHPYHHGGPSPLMATLPARHTKPGAV